MTFETLLAIAILASALSMPMTSQLFDYLRGNKGYRHTDYFFNTSRPVSWHGCAVICMSSPECKLFTVDEIGCYGYKYLFPIYSDSVPSAGAKTYRRYFDTATLTCDGEFKLGVNGDICYLVKNETNRQVSWTSAMLDCMSIGSALFSFETEAKRSSYNAVVSEYPGLNWWMGGVQVNEEDKVWMWWNGHPVGSWIWKKPGEPNNIQPDERCLELGLTFQGNDVTCSYPRNYICEKRI